MKIIRIAVMSSVAALLCAAAAHAEKIERRAAADPRGEVIVSNLSGTVRVTGWDRPEIEVNADLGRNADHLDFDRDGKLTRIKVVLQNGHLFSSPDSDLVIHVPRDSQLTIETVSATQTVENVAGAQRLQTVSGDIRTQVWSDDLEVKSVSGEVTAQGQKKNIPTENGKDSAARTHVTTVSGMVTLSDIDGELEVGTVSGEMEVRSSTLTRARLKTTSGDLHLTAMLTRDARIDAEAISGDITFDFDREPAAEFDVETFSGNIDNCFGPKPKRKQEYGPGNEWRFKEDNSQAHVRVRTLSGRVKICHKN
jgi:DUF4097 and DUF4098 domain-containing protein YvlB